MSLRRFWVRRLAWSADQAIHKEAKKVAGDKGFKKAEGVAGDDEMENERGQTTIGEEGDHGWAPDSGKASEPNKQAGDRAFESRDQSKESTSERTNT